MRDPVICEKGLGRHHVMGKKPGTKRHMPQDPTPHGVGRLNAEKQSLEHGWKNASPETEKLSLTEVPGVCSSAWQPQLPSPRQEAAPSTHHKPCLSDRHELTCEICILHMQNATLQRKYVECFLKV